MERVFKEDSLGPTSTMPASFPGQSALKSALYMYFTSGLKLVLGLHYNVLSLIVTCLGDPD